MSNMKMNLIKAGSFVYWGAVLSIGLVVFLFRLAKTFLKYPTLSFNQRLHLLEPNHFS